MNSLLGAGALTCPHCHSPIGPDDTACPGCGADLQLLTLAAEPGWLLPDEPAIPQAALPLSTEQLVPRLGDYLVQHGFIETQDLQAALDYQAQAGGEQRHRLGQTLVDLGCLSFQALDQAIAGRLHELQAALLDSNRELERRVVQRTAELKAALARLTEFNQLKANLVANISHELRTPLTHIKGYNVLLLEGTLGDLSPDQQHALAITSSAIERLEQLINDLISYAAATRGELTLNLRPVGLPALIRQVYDRLAPKAARQQVRLEADVPGELPRVQADEEKLLWTLLQLVENGVKFTRAGGRVSISARPQAQLVVLAVSDTGIGIPADQLEDIFEPFRQLDSSSTRRYSGTGLGLALVRRIVEAHGATMLVQSQPGEGSTFSFSLPAQPAA